MHRPCPTNSRHAQPWQGSWSGRRDPCLFPRSRSGIDLASSIDGSVARTGSRSSSVAWWGVCLLILAAPFEPLRPLISFPGQSLSGLETLLLLVAGVWFVAVLADGPTARVSLMRVLSTPLTVPWMVFLAAMLVAALAGVDRTNGLHMTGRFLLTFLVYLVTVNGVTTVKRLRIVVIAAALAGVLVAVLAVLEYLNIQPVLQLLTVFRPRISVIGTQVRAGGPFQYPTIASMFLEIVFALVLGLLLLAIDAHRTRPSRASDRLWPRAVCASDLRSGHADLHAVGADYDSRQPCHCRRASRVALSLRSWNRSCSPSRPPSSCRS